MSEAALLALCSRSAHDQKCDQQGWSHSGTVVDHKIEETCAGEDQASRYAGEGKRASFEES